MGAPPGMIPGGAARYDQGIARRCLIVPSTRVGDLDVVWDVAGPPAGAPVLMIDQFGTAAGRKSKRTDDGRPSEPVS